MKSAKIASLFFVALVFATGFMPKPAIAGPYSDDLAKCLVSNTTDADKTLLTKWFFAVASLNPALGKISNITDAQRESIDKKMAKLYERLITESCKTQAQQAVKYEGASALEVGFRVLGFVAGRELFASPKVREGIKGLDKYVDKEKLKKVLGIDDQ